MDMRKVRIRDVAEALDSATVQRPLTNALGAEHVSLNYYELAVGDSFAFGYHSHASQEEIFIITAGEVEFETDDGTITVEAGEAIRFASGDFQQGTNRGTARVKAFVLGAPQETGETTVFRHCDTCGDRTRNTIRRVDDGSAKITRCLACDTETARFT